MSRLKLYMLSLFLIGFMFCAFGTSSSAQIGPGGDMPSNGPDRLGAGANTPGAGGNMPSDGPKGSRGFQQGERPLVLTPLEPVVIGSERNNFFYEIINATPGGEVFILEGIGLGTSDNLLCLNLQLDIIGIRIQDILVADRSGYARGTKTVHPGRIGDFIATYMQAVDAEACKKSNVIEVAPR